MGKKSKSKGTKMVESFKSRRGRKSHDGDEAVKAVEAKLVVAQPIASTPAPKPQTLPKEDSVSKLSHVDIALGKEVDIGLYRGGRMLADGEAAKKVAKLLAEQSLTGVVIVERTVGQDHQFMMCQLQTVAKDAKQLDAYRLFKRDLKAKGLTDNTPRA